MDEISKKPSIILPEGWFWVEYEDGSGCLRGPNGQRMFSYDKNSREIRDMNGEYQFYDAFDEALRCELEQKLLEELESTQQVNIENALPIVFFSNGMNSRSTEYYILPASDWIIEVCAFTELACCVAIAEHKNYADQHIRPYELGKRIAAAAESAEKQFSHEGKVFSVERILNCGKLFRKEIK